MIIYFFIGQVLGKGGFAKVFKAERIISADLASEPISSSTVAVKVSSFLRYYVDLRHPGCCIPLSSRNWLI